jgi:prepilin-type N-terminal cleavage/methylation domain-containing protein
MLNTPQLRHSRRAGPTARSGFTLLEIMIVIAVHGTGE